MPLPLARLLVFLLCLAPLLWLGLMGFTGGLGPDPAKAVVLFSGEWALRFLLLTLLMSVLRRHSGSMFWLRIRRMLGLYTFFYASLHLLAFTQFYTGWSAGIFVEELIERPYIAVGMLAWLLMLPLAISSTRAWQRRLGRRWVKLHRAIYPALALACLHLLWQARSDLGEALIYGTLGALLLAWRVWRWRQKKTS